MAVVALGGFVVEASALGTLFVFAGDWALGDYVVGGLALEAALPLVTPRFIG